jgi:hypothetical protein
VEDLKRAKAVSNRLATSTCNGKQNMNPTSMKPASTGRVSNYVSKVVSYVNFLRS